MEKSKTAGQVAYDAEIKREPLYRATRERRPAWLELSDKARDAWEDKAETDGA